MGWRIEFDDSAEKEFGKLSRDTQQKIRDYLRHKVLVLEDPRLLGRPLRGEKSGFWRYRVGKYRIICHVQDDCLIVLVLRIGKRDRIYKDDF